MILPLARGRPVLPRRAHADGALAGLVDLLELGRRVEDVAAGREIGPLDVAAQLHARQLLVVEQLDERGADLVEVVRRDVGRHADGDAGGAVDQQVRNARRQHDRLGARAVVVGPERNRLLLDLLQDLVRDAREAALGVAHRRGGIAVERAEVAGAVDERHAQRERLRHAHERFVDRGVAVRVVVAHHVADDLGALAMLGVGGQVLLPHRVEDAALHRLEPVAHVGQRARGDDRQRVVQISRLRRFVQRDAGAVVKIRRRPADHRWAAVERRHRDRQECRREKVRACAWPRAFTVARNESTSSSTKARRHEVRMILFVPSCPSCFVSACTPESACPDSSCCADRGRA